MEEEKRFSFFPTRLIEALLEKYEEKDNLDIEEEKERLEEDQETDFWGKEDDWDELDDESETAEEPILYHKTTEDGRDYHETLPFVNRFWGKNPKCPICQGKAPLKG